MYEDEMEEEVEETPEVSGVPEKRKPKEKREIKAPGKKATVYRISKRHLGLIDENGNGFRVPIGKRTNVKIGDSIFIE